VEEVGRTRILEAVAEAMLEHGGGSVPIAEVIASAGVSSGAFHEAFPNREACLLAAFDLATDRARARVAPAYLAQPRWLDAVKAALAQFLGFLEDEPALGRLLIVYSMGGGEQVLRRRVRVMDELASAVDRGRQEGPAARQDPPEIVAEGVVGAVLAILQNRLLEGGPAGVRSLFGSLVSIIVLPYLGVGVARRELTRPAPRMSSGPGMGAAARVGDGSLEYRAGTHVTYRTARVLGAIGDYPGASNREIADRAGIVDQGQISKLLSRLQARGLIAKIDVGSTRGAPNSWRLTERGELVLGEVCAVS
jgi:AcrR family transcriptional regulator